MRLGVASVRRDARCHEGLSLARFICTALALAPAANSFLARARVQAEVRAQARAT